MDIGKTIKVLRNKKGLTQQQLADKIHKTVSSIKKYESGENTIPTDVLIDIVNALDAKLSIYNEDILEQYILTKCTDNIEKKELDEIKNFIDEYLNFKIYLTKKDQ